MNAPEEGSELVAYRARVTGLVQGVGFRVSTWREACRLRVCGYVRNEDDGSVTIHAEGEPSAVDALIAWCHRGPPHSRVARVEKSEVAPIGAIEFEVSD